MKIDEGDVIPGLEDVLMMADEQCEKTVSEICEEELNRQYDESWLGDVFRRIDATDLDGDVNYDSSPPDYYYDSGAGVVTFDKYARGTSFTDGWDSEWLRLLIQSIKDEALQQVRERCTVVNDSKMDRSDVDEHFSEEHGFHNAECFCVKPNVYFYVSPDMFGYDVIRRDFTVEHRCNLSNPYKTNCAIASTRRGFRINGTGVLYDTRNEMQRE